MAILEGAGENAWALSVRAAIAASTKDAAKALTLAQQAARLVPLDVNVQTAVAAGEFKTLAAALHRSEAVLPQPKGVDARDDLWILLEILRRANPDRAQRVGYGAAQATPEGFAHFKEGIEQKMLANCLKPWTTAEPGVAERVPKDFASKGFAVLGEKRYDELPYRKPLDTPSGKIEVYALRAVQNAALRKAKADPLPEYRPITAYTLPKAPDEFYVVSLEALVRMKLTSFLFKDRVHLQDLMGVGLIDAS